MKRLLERIVARPRVYDFVQRAAGAEAVRRRMAALIESAVADDAPRTRAGRPRVIDVGGGTGGWRRLWPAGASYVCLDLDPLKLRGFRARHPSGLAVQADATRLPLADAAVDGIACTFLSHHLTDVHVDRMLAECARVLRPGGVFAFADPVWAPARLPGRLLWRYDRGSFPRTAETLREALARHFNVLRWERFAVFHAYALCVASPR
jgi:SAM-dependent methyltransferase